mgnify:CR=1 FL=1
MTKAHLIDNLADAGASISKLITALIGDTEVPDGIPPEFRHCPVPRADGRQAVAELARVVTRLNEVIRRAA